MARRASARTAALAAAPAASLVPSVNPDPPLPPEVTLLRRQWKWAAFGQFFYVFGALFNMPDVTIADIEDDLTKSMNLVLPRIMHRLLYTVTQDRKASLDNWQNVLRKQYLKRDPEANPLGSEPFAASRDVSTIPTAVQSKDVSMAPEPSSNGTKVEQEDADAPMDGVQGKDLDQKGGDEVKEEADTKETDEADEVMDGHTAPEDEQKKETADKEDAAAAQDHPSKAEDTPADEEEPELAPPVDWRDLPMLTKLESMHTVMEWHFQNPLRLRQLMKSDNETASWRVEPIGYDAKSNAYWLIGEDRLWIQRQPPKPPKNSKKRKRAPNKQPVTKAPVKGKGKPETPSKRPRMDPSSASVGTPTRSSGRGRRAPQPEPEPEAEVTSNGRSVRAAKLNANLKLDAQAKQFAEFQKQAEAERRSSRSSTKVSPVRPVGTRVSARLRGPAAEDEWQPVPDEWLEDENPVPAKVAKATATPRRKSTRVVVSTPKAKTGLESDEESTSELTELSSEQNPDASANADSAEQPGDAQVGADVEEKVPLPADFVEWETICVTLYEWEHIAERFEKSNHYLEKTLYKVLAESVVPIVTAQLKEIEKKKRIEEALSQRKRSSRLATKESEREEAIAAAKRRAEEEEKMARERRLEARLLKEQQEREKKEQAREQRRKDREERERRQAERRWPTKELEDEEEKNKSKDVSKLSKGKAVNGVRAEKKSAIRGSSGTNSGTRTPVGEDWELDCEVCHRRGRNQDDGMPMMSCGKCNKWQHITCHDRADLQAGRRKRNWDTEEFFCQRCRPTAAHSQTQFRYDQRSQPYNYGPPQHQAYGQHNGYQQVQQPPPQRHPITFTHYQPQQHGFSAPHTYQNPVASDYPVHPVRTQHPSLNGYSSAFHPSNMPPLQAPQVNRAQNGPGPMALQRVPERTPQLHQANWGNGGPSLPGYNPTPAHISRPEGYANHQQSHYDSGGGGQWQAHGRFQYGAGGSPLPPS